MNELAVNFECPICSNKIILFVESNCKNCGWQIIVFSGKPNKIYIDKLESSRKTLKNNFDVLNNKNKNDESSKDHIAKLKKDLNYQKDRKLEISKEYESILFRNKKVKSKLTSLESTIPLEGKLQVMEKELQQLYFNKEQIEINQSIPNISLNCNYSWENNCVTVYVEENRDPIKSLSSELVFAVAFFEYQKDSYLEADLIIPTEAKKIKFLESGQEINFKLKYRPNEKLGKYGDCQVIHLLASNISQYSI